MQHHRTDDGAPVGGRAGVSWTAHQEPGGHGEQPGCDHPLAPNRSARRAARGRSRPAPTANGSVCTPARQRREAPHELEVLGDEEDEAEQGEEGDGHGHAGGGEAGVARRCGRRASARGAGAPSSRSAAMSAAGARANPSDGRRRRPARRSGASITVHTSRAMRPPIDSMSPTGSNRPACGSCEVGSSCWPATRATTTIGTLTKKTEPHQKCSSSKPPVTGPRATARPDTPTRCRWPWPARSGR